MVEDILPASETPSQVATNLTVLVKPKQPYTRQINVKFPKELVLPPVLFDRGAKSVFYRADVDATSENSGTLANELSGQEGAEIAGNILSDDECNRKRVKQTNWWISEHPQVFHKQW